MEMMYKKGTVILNGVTCFDLDQTFDCGQAFRFKKINMKNEEDSAYFGIVQENPVVVLKSGENVTIFGISEDTYNKKWYSYFDFQRDYEEVIKAVSIDDTMKKAAEFGRGIRILRQDPFETLISFIISQNNNIPRIKKIINALCKNFGEPCDYSEILPFFKNFNIDFDEFNSAFGGFYSFPKAEKLAVLDIDELSSIRAGFRAKYILDAAKKVAFGEIDLSSLRFASYEDTAKTLMKINGVGPKVADCVALFGFSHIEAFPVDVWIKRILEHFYNTPDFSPSVFAPYGGIAQQYLFYYAKKNTEIFAK